MESIPASSRFERPLRIFTWAFYCFYSGYYTAPLIPQKGFMEGRTPYRFSLLYRSKAWVFHLFPIYIMGDYKFFFEADGEDGKRVCFEMRKTVFSSWKIIDPVPTEIHELEKELQQHIAMYIKLHNIDISNGEFS